VWPASSPELNLVDYRIWGKLQERVYRATGFVTDVDQLKSRMIEEWEQYHNFSSRSLTKRSNSGVSIFKLAFEHAEDKGHFEHKLWAGLLFDISSATQFNNNS